ncbi:MAG: type II toxin-antitoxin system RelE/ParE family toxin [Chloroflexi bacterium]|nr:type II toxin-antitoxin system RelE/ParE family toxin [Chloroflexota bacterium]
MPYRIRLTETARREIDHLPGHVRQRVRRLVEDLGDNPMSARAVELRGLPGRFRIPLLHWRIIYRVDDQAETVLVLTVRRKLGPETYQDLE